jgi:hypothetical protein
MDYTTIIYIVAIAILFLIVIRNNRNNKRKLYDRKSRNFRENFQAKRKAAQEENKQSGQEK